jgi:hypothetical protein
VISGGHATSTASGATITWTSSQPASFMLTIAGPGKINGHTATVTKPEAVFRTGACTPFTPLSSSGSLH